MKETAKSSHEIFEVRGFKAFALRLLGRLVRRWQGTLKYDVPEISLNLFKDNPNGFLFLFWHNRLFGGTGALEKSDINGHKLHALVSASRDGAQLSQFLRTLNIYPIRGSSSRRGSGALRELIKTMEQGNAVAITVDGPRGPCYEAQQGAALLMQQTGVPAYLIGVECESCWELSSWDRFIIPKPFSRVKIKMDRLAPVLSDDGKEGRKTIQELIQKRLDRLTEDVHRKL